MATVLDSSIENSMLKASHMIMKIKRVHEIIMKDTKYKKLRSKQGLRAPDSNKI